MTLSRNALSLALLAALAAPAAHAEIAIDTIGGSEVSFEGQIQADYNYFDSDVRALDNDPNDGSDSDQEVRRAEFVLKGKGPGDLSWVVGYDAKADKWLDVNAKYKLGGNSVLTVGQHKQPTGMEQLSSSKNNDFISKAMLTNSFAVGRRLGTSYSYAAKDWSLTASWFGRELTRNLAHGSGYGVRGIWAPVNETGSILHLGLSYADYDTDADTLRLRARPDADLTSVRLIDTGSMADTDRVSSVGFESMWINGPFKLQGEYMKTSADRYGTGNDDFSGTAGYVSGVWNVTGETWGYKGGTPTTGKPHDPASGMWQLGLRYDTMDLDDGTVQGGRMDTWTAGINWYWRSNFKFMLNHVMVDSERQDVEDNPNITEARIQFYW